METLTHRVLAQNKEIKIFGEDTPESLAQMIIDEAMELAQAIREAGVTDDMTEVASEVGDLGYLIIRVADELGIPLASAIEMKILRNHAKYHGQPDAVTAKEAWKAGGGDGLWFQAYLETLATDAD